MSADAIDTRRTVHFSTPAPVLTGRGGKHLSLADREPGRPQLYRPEYCELVEQLARDKGYGPAQLATHIGVSKRTLYQWAEVCEEFSHSLSRAKTFEQAWWEARGQRSLGAKHFQAQAWRMSMAARFKDEYSEGNGKAVELHLDLRSIVDRSLDQAKEIAPAAVTLEPPKA